MAVVGFLMFGRGVKDEITANILEEMGYPAVTHILLVALIAIIPLTKVPLTAQPIVTTFEVLFGLRENAEEEGAGRRRLSSTASRAVVRVVTLLVFLAVAILFPAFDSIMAFMGSALCFTICVT